MLDTTISFKLLFLNVIEAHFKRGQNKSELYLIHSLIQKETTKVLPEMGICAQMAFVLGKNDAVVVKTPERLSGKY